MKTALKNGVKLTGKNISKAAKYVRHANDNIKKRAWITYYYLQLKVNHLWSNRGKNIKIVKDIANTNYHYALNEIQKFRQEHTIESMKKRSKLYYEQCVEIANDVWHANDNNTENVKAANDAAKLSVKLGMWASAAVLFFFIGWAGLAPIDSAAVASGYVTLFSQKKTVQHLEGGIIKEILINEGDVVEAGQPLINLNDSEAKARYSIVLGQLRTALANEARLNAELNGANQITLPEEFDNIFNEFELFKIVQSQNNLFKTRKEVLEEKVSILQQRIEQSNNQVDGLKSQQKATDKKLLLIQDEAKAKESLLEQGWGKKPDLLLLQRTEADLVGQKGEYISSIAKVEEGIKETELQILNIKNQFTNDALDELKEVQSKIADLQQQFQAAKDVLDRTVIKAPQSGKITGLNYHTIGGVITHGSPIMDIVPQDDKMIIEAQVKVTDIDIVHKGLDAKVMLSAYKSRLVPRLQGVVLDVSADRFVDEHMGMPYYKARVEISEEQMAHLPENIELYPGMPAEVFIVTGESTLLQYMFDPLTSSVRRSFTEQ